MAVLTLAPRQDRFNERTWTSTATAASAGEFVPHARNASRTAGRRLSPGRGEHAGEAIEARCLPRPAPSSPRHLVCSVVAAAAATTGRDVRGVSD